ALCFGLAGQFDEHRPVDNYANGTIGRPARLVSCLKDTHVRENGSWTSNSGHYQALFNPRSQVAGQHLLQVIACVGYKAGMDISPMLLEVGVHSRKRTGHG